MRDEKIYSHTVDKRTRILTLLAITKNHKKSGSETGKDKEKFARLEVKHCGQKNYKGLHQIHFLNMLAVIHMQGCPQFQP